MRKKVCNAIPFFLISFAFIASPLQAKEPVGLSELNRLIQLHLPKKFHEDVGPSKKIKLLPESGETVFTIPGFEAYGCGECHQAEQLLDLSIDRMRKSLVRLSSVFPDPPPLKQFIIQSWSDEWLRDRKSVV